MGGEASGNEGGCHFSKKNLWDFPYIWTRTHWKNFHRNWFPPHSWAGRKWKWRIFFKNPLRFPICLNRNTLKKVSSKLVPPSFMGGKQVKLRRFVIFPKNSFEISHKWEISKNFGEKCVIFTCSPPMTEGGTSLDENFFNVLLLKYMGDLKGISFSLASRPWMMGEPVWRF